MKCIRNSKWKLIHNVTPDNWELYNLEKDPFENDNVVELHSQIVTELKLKMSKIEEDCLQNN